MVIFFFRKSDKNKHILNMFFRELKWQHGKKISEKKNKGRFHWKKEKNKGEILHEKENLKSNEIDFTHKSSTCTGIQKVSTVTILHS